MTWGLLAMTAFLLFLDANVPAGTKYDPLLVKTLAAIFGTLLVAGMIYGVYLCFIALGAAMNFNAFLAIYNLLSLFSLFVKGVSDNDD